MQCLNKIYALLLMFYISLPAKADIIQPFTGKAEIAKPFYIILAVITLIVYFMIKREITENNDTASTAPVQNSQNEEQ